ncbi:MAG: alanine--tRNA ligase [Deferribacteres bacterium]|nr:alanine--tRNA ligase [candidate division KSB1 bacterium]MCB9511769.1 alanine--tRNA ligase [Deferribacteres bacterium]
MTASEIRQSFLDFFKEKQHAIVPSAPVVPQDDPTLLFTNAGMNQFKNIFLDLEEPASKRAADTQKCIRVSGKHNDLEDVGFDTYHHTFFEMLGNWSFGDYFKKEAIAWAWELLTEKWGIPKERLYATVFAGDDADGLEPDTEAENLWKEVTDIKPENVLRFGKKDNFWEMGDTGPCGPCSEIHIDLTPDMSGGKLVNADDPRVIEVWNLVFIQYNRLKSGRLEPLPAKHVDTGMGFERIVAVLQGKDSNYDTDVFTPLISEISKLSGVNYPGPDNGMAHRVIADHIRTLTFAIGDGSLPSNDGRGYVLRRILRRAARFGRTLGLHEPFIYKLVPRLTEMMGEVFPELREKQEYISLVIKSEEESFNQTLDRGLEIFEKIVTTVREKNKTAIPGDEAFRLYDTYGFPLDLTELMAREQSLTVDNAGFEEAMDEQRKRAREAGKWELAIDYQPEKWDELSKGTASRFIGYTDLEADTEIRRLMREDGRVFFTLADTPFYAQSGGQVGDRGIIEGDGFRIRVLDTQKVGSHIVHVGEVDGELGEAKVIARVDAARRRDTERNHTATHLLHQALRDTLGTHVSQAGSLVSPERLRFDVTHFQKMEFAQLEDIEGQVNEHIRQDLEIETFTTSFVEARKLGAMAIFEEKYGETVRVVKIGDYSLELCGGTHLTHTGQAGYFNILAESSAAAGIRRLEALTGSGAEAYLRSARRIEDELQQLLHCQRDDLTTKVQELLEQRRQLEHEMQSLRGKLAGQEISGLVAQASALNGFRYVASKVHAQNVDELRTMSDTLRNQLRSGVGVLAAEINQKVTFVCIVTDDLIQDKKLRAGDIVKQVAAIAGGSGGGKPHMALAGGKDTDKIDAALKEVPGIVQGMVNG